MEVVEQTVTTTELHAAAALLLRLRRRVRRGRRRVQHQIRFRRRAKDGAARRCRRRAAPTLRVAVHFGARRAAAGRLRRRVAAGRLRRLPLAAAGARARRPDGARAQGQADDVGQRLDDGNLLVVEPQPGRVFEVDGLACACGGRLVLHAVVQPPATLDVLESLERSAANRQPRAPPQVA